MNSVEENIMEMTLVWSQIADQLDDDVDSVDIKQSIVGWAKEFEETYKEIEWGWDNNPDYYETIENFAKRRLLNTYGKAKDNVHNLIFVNTPIGDLYMLSGDNSIRRYVEIGIRVTSNGALIPITSLEVNNRSGNEGEKYMTLYRSDFGKHHYFGLKPTETFSLAKLNEYAKMMESED